MRTSTNKHNILKKLIKEEIRNILREGKNVGEVGTWLCNELSHESNNMMNESTHPWYTSSEGYYKGQSGVGIGPRHTGNVIDFLKPNTLVYNDNGDMKTIKTVSDSHIIFTDGTKDYFMNWFPEKPELTRKTSKFHKTA